MIDNESELQVDEAVARLGLPRTSVEKCGLEKAREVVRTAKERFVEGNPRAWWMALKQPHASYPYRKEDWPLCVIQHVPREAQVCWFIIESDSDEYPVYRVVCDEVPKLLGECGFFEYYLVGEVFMWLIADTDHNEIVVSVCHGAS